MKTELEEAAKRLYPYVNDEVRLLFINGAKWQQKRMYSEEEVWSIIKMVAGLKDGGKTDTEISNYFEQFKKK